MVEAQSCSLRSFEQYTLSCLENVIEDTTRSSYEWPKLWHVTSQRRLDFSLTDSACRCRAAAADGRSDTFPEPFFLPTVAC